MASTPPKEIMPMPEEDSNEAEKKMGEDLNKEDLNKEDLNKEDLDALDDFCNSFEIENLSFDEFCRKHENLDISIPLMLTLDEIHEGGKTKVEFTRTVKIQTRNGIRITKEKLIIEVSWQPGSSNGDVISIANKGDKDHGDKEGNLLVTLKVS